jgi:signal transduction histidine kinase
MRALNSSILTGAITLPEAPGAYSWSEFLRNLCGYFVVNTLIGLVFGLLRGDWLTSQLISHTFGWSIFLCSLLAHKLTGPLPGRRALITTAGIFGGVLLGFALNLWLVQPHWYQEMMARPVSFGLGMATSFTIVAPFVAASLIRDRLREARLEMDKQRAEQAERQAEIERRSMLAQLQQLQAQIEPHFLFNTLATVISMIDEEPAQARLMLVNFNDYLRASLRRSRATETTLGQEFELLRHYLAIMQLRMGSRLSFQLDCPSELSGHALPPMLLQPLVENALVHGLEPTIDGGEIRVTATHENAQLMLRVVDNGAGLQGSTGQGGHGIGLDNVRKRLKGIYGEQAKLRLQAHAPHGTLAEISLPFPELSSQ